MCGIFGYCTSVKIPRLKQIATVLAGMNQSRGSDAWGTVVWKAHEKEYEINKGSGPIMHNLYKIPFAEQAGFLVGHTRAATVGDKTDEKAHPFRYVSNEGDEVIGVHNGSIRNWQELNKKYERDLEVDSMHIFKHMADGLPLGDVEGSGAIVYIQKKGIYFSKFNGGSLSIARVKDAGLVWSSDATHLKVALMGANLDYTMYNVKEDVVYWYADDELWSSGEKIGISSYIHKQTHYVGGGSSAGSTFRSTDSEIRKKVGGIKVKMKVILDLEAIRKNFLKSNNPEGLMGFDEFVAYTQTLPESVTNTSPYGLQCCGCRKQTTRLWKTERYCLDCIYEGYKAGKITLPPAVASEPTPMIATA
jgi:predicted glutamine amidotransferase